jgi:hypothetical protein
MELVRSGVFRTEDTEDTEGHGGLMGRTVELGIVSGRLV